MCLEESGVKKTSIQIAGQIPPRLRLTTRLVSTIFEDCISVTSTITGIAKANLIACPNVLRKNYAKCTRRLKEILESGLQLIVNFRQVTPDSCHCLS
ncbi:hypothetical protein CQ018_11965 [Arthrobacter sp. MYb227]|nr:hypothetical protein CQ018_11965 [Arthrobacter sp. MYb227]